MARKRSPRQPDAFVPATMEATTAASDKAAAEAKAAIDRTAKAQADADAKAAKAQADADAKAGG